MGHLEDWKIFGFTIPLVWGCFFLILFSIPVMLYFGMDPLYICCDTFFFIMLIVWADTHGPLGGKKDGEKELDFTLKK